MNRKLLFLILIVAACLNTRHLHATTHTIIAGHSGTTTFLPSSLTVAMGDTIMWIWETGFHTTTSGSIPSGAASWNHSLDNSSTSFMYVPTVLGTYNYVCTPHQSMGMVGSFIVANTSVGTVAGNGDISINPNPASNGVRIHTDMHRSPDISIVNVIGSSVSGFYVFQESADDVYLDISSLPQGIYYLKLKFGEMVTTKKLIIAR